jgi:arginine/lysine/ornithine decarboxylase
MARLRQSGTEGFNMLDPIKATIITPGLDVDGEFADSGIPAAIVTRVPGGTRRHCREMRAVFLLHHVHHRHHQGALEHDC